MNINLKNVSKRYQGNLTYTLENINLEINSGEFVAFLGPSGCGKTTMLRMIAGLNSITKGDLLFGSTKVNNLEPKDRNIAMVFQSYALYPHMTVYKNMAYSLQIRKVQKQLIDQRVKDVAKILEIEHLLYSKPSEISGGQRQRVALGRAIVRKPAIFLMDEPLSNLDAKLRDSMRVELVKIHKLLNTTTIYVTHDQLEAMTMADKIVLFNDGAIQQAGKPTELYSKPANLFVAKFIGSPSMNFIDVKINKEKETILTHALAQKIDFRSVFESANKINDETNEFVIGIRPEHVVISSAKPDGNSYIKCSVVTNELIGKESIISAEYGKKQQVRATVAGTSDLTYGDIIYIQISESKVHLFDKKNGTRIN